MNKRVFLVSVTATLIAVGVIGILLYIRGNSMDDAAKRRESETQHQISKQQEAEAIARAQHDKALEAQAELKAAEEGRKAAEARQAAEEARLKANLAETARIEAERNRAREEDERRRRDMKESEERKQKDEKEKDLTRQNEERYKALFEERERKRRTVAYEFSINPADAKEIFVARVHEGDEVSISVGRERGANTKIYAGIAGNLTHLHDYSSRGPYYEKTIVTFPLKDKDTFLVNSALTKTNDDRGFVGSRDGARLFIGTGVTGVQPDSNGAVGRMRISVSIFSNNRYDIIPIMERPNT